MERKLNEKIKNILNETNSTPEYLEEKLKENGIDIDIYSENTDGKFLNIIKGLTDIPFVLKSPEEKENKPDAKKIKSLRDRQRVTFREIDIIEENLRNYFPEILDILLKDHTTGKNIIWATGNYVGYGEEYNEKNEIKPELITGSNSNLIQPRVKKNRSEQLQRTRDKAEVFTPSWMCNRQNNLVDNAWFGYKNVFNSEKSNNTWAVKKDKIVFPQGKTWKDYVRAPRLEITCGEAPYLISRYDTVTGSFIPLERRIGLLDRKIRVINENTDKDHRIEWMKWVKTAYQNIYGYDFQGDNVLLARESLLAGFYEYYIKRFPKEDLYVKEIKEIAEVISWNIWQMDGLTMMPPFEEYSDNSNMNTFDFETGEELRPVNNFSVIMDWEENKPVEFKSLVKKDN